MQKIVVKKDKFKNALAKIEKDSQNNRDINELEKFDEKSGLFGLFPKKVTGQEMNAFTAQLQDNLLKMNSKINAFYKQFSDVYTAFETLDKEYISGIVGAFNQAIEATKRADDAQKSVNRTVDILKKTVEKIKEFNDKVSYELSRIDSENWRENALKYKRELEDLDSKTEEIVQTITQYKEQYEDLKFQLESYRKEKRKTGKLFLAMSITTGISVFTMVILILLVVFDVL